MSHGSPGTGSSSSSASPSMSAEVIGRLPRGPLTPQQQLEAAQRVQAQAEHRIALSTQFFKAAEARVAGQQAQLDQLKAEQDAMRERLETDVTKTLHAYDQWVGQMDENFTRTIRQLEDRVDKLHEQWVATQARLDTMMKRSTAMLEQSRDLLAKSIHARHTAAEVPPAPSATPAPPQARPAKDDAISPQELSIYRTLLRRMQDERDRDQRDAAA